VIVVRVPPPAPTELVAEAIPLAIVYEDDDVVVIDKPAGLVVHPAADMTAARWSTRCSATFPTWKALARHRRRSAPRHRTPPGQKYVGADRRRQERSALQFLQEQFKARTIKKMYLALVEGIVEPREGIIDAPIGRSHAERKKMAVTREGRSARTRYRVRRVYRQPDLSLVEAYPETGRTHQIRVHFAWLKHPLVGDELYGRQKPVVPIERHFLHAASLTLTLPNGAARTFTSDLPGDLRRVLEQLTAAEK